ncbi:MAG: hypothetical protein ACJA0T_000387 [Colwellia sp.]|jgi:hypothetical protein
MIIKKMLDKHSPEVQEPKQTKEQTKLIAQGIEKGIAEYKKQQSKKSRMRDKAKKSLLREKNNQEKSTEACPQETPSKRALYLPWLLLVISWIGFIFYSQ